MSIFQNAIDSIELGIEDYQINTPERLMSAVRNFYAGILLLFKAKLSELSLNSDESLLKQQIIPVHENGAIIWKGKGKKTVDYDQIIERLKSLGIDIDKQRLDAIRSYRNNIEHYYDKDKTKSESVRQYISSCFIIIRDFIAVQFSKDPKECFKPEIWTVLVKETEVYQAEKGSCLESLQSLAWRNEIICTLFSKYICDACGSDLIEPLDKSIGDSVDAKFRCRICDEEWEYFGLLIIVCEKEAEDDWRSIADGGNPTFIDCPDCGNKCYYTCEEICLKCEVEGPFICKRCGMDIPYEELDYFHRDYCSYCDHMMSKDD